MRHWIWKLTPLLCSCSVLFEPPSARQCESDADCEVAGEPGRWSCEENAGVCVGDRTAATLGCESTDACMADNGGLPALCRFPGTPCVKLVTPECPQVSGEWRAGDALFLGSIGTRTLRQAEGTSAPQDYVQRLQQAIELGVEEWNRQVPEGLSFSRRPMAMVQCDSSGDPVIAERAMAHLLEDIDVPVVFALTDIDHEAIEQQALGAEITLVGVDSHEPEVLPPQIEGGLVWRMLPMLAEQTELAAWRVSDLEQTLRTERGLDSTTPLRVAVWGDSGAAFDAYITRVRGALRYNGGQNVEQNGENYLELRNVDPRYETQPLGETVERMLGFAPDIIVAAVNEDFTTYYLRLLEAQWPGAIPKPQYVLTALNQELATLAPAVGGDDDLRRRLSGTGLVLDADVASNRAGFRVRYFGQYGVDPGRTQAGYDAWYATALAIYSADAGGRLDGASIAGHFPRLMSGSPTNVDPLAMGSARVFLAAQRGVDLVGTSSQLDWEPITHRARAEVGLWCLSRDAAGALQIDDDAGVRWAASGATGIYDCP